MKRGESLLKQLMQEYGPTRIFSYLVWVPVWWFLFLNPLFSRSGFYLMLLLVLIFMVKGAVDYRRGRAIAPPCFEDLPFSE